MTTDQQPDGLRKGAGVKTDRELMQQALEALDRNAWAAPRGSELEAVYVALRERLAQPVQEPVAWMSIGGFATCSKREAAGWVEAGGKATPLYTAPPTRQPLTDETLWEMWVESPSDVLRFGRAVERAHGIGGDQ